MQHPAIGHDDAKSAVTFREMRTHVKLDYIEHFNARGMRCVYGRGDHFGRPKPVFHLDLWKNRDGRLLARAWSRGQEVDWESWEVIGLEQADYPYADERWVPWCLRKAYDNWVLANF